MSSTLCVASAARSPLELDDARERAADRSALGALVLGALAIGTAPLCVKLGGVGPAATGFWRLALAAPIVFLLARIRSDADRPLSPGQRLKLVGAGALFAADLTVWHAAMNYTTVVVATLVANLSPVFVALGDFAFHGRRLGRVFLLGLGTAVLGMAWLSTPDGLPSGGQALGLVLALMAAVAYAGYLLVLKNVATGLRPARAMTWTTLSAALLLWPAALTSGERLQPIDGRAWTALVTLALVSQVFGQTLVTRGLARLPASFSAVTLLIQPIAAAVLAAAILGEPLTPRLMVGGSIVLAGIVLARRGSADTRGDER